MTKLLLTPVAVFLAFFAVACNGHSINDRNAEWCVEDAELLAPAKEAADEWRERSDGEVAFSFRVADECPDLPRIRYGSDVDADAVGHMDVGELVISTRHGDLGAHPSLFLHEFGHYLTGVEHSADERDVMTPNGPIADWVHLTDADVARLDWPSARIKKGWD